jgi:hypothetical protein
MNQCQQATSNIANGGGSGNFKNLNIADDENWNHFRNKRI